MTKFRILTLNNISHQALLRFTPDRYAVGKHVDIPTDPGALARHACDDDSPHGEGDRTCWHRNQHIPVATMSDRGMPVFNAPGADANAVRELVLAALLIGARNLVPALQFVAGLPRDADFEAHVEEGKKNSRASSCRTARWASSVWARSVRCGRHGAEARHEGRRSDPEITVDAAWRLQSAVRKAHRSTKC